MSVRNQLITLGALTVVLLAIAAVTTRQMGVALEARLVERARAEARWEAERQESGHDLGMPPSCTSGHIHSGVLAPGEALDVNAPGLAAVITSGLEDAESRSVEGVALRYEGAPLVVATSETASGLAWAAVVVADPPKMQIWRIVGGVVFLLAMTVIVGALRMGWQLRRDVDELVRALRDLAEDLLAPVPRFRAEEIQALGDGVSELANRLRDTHEREQDLQSELTTQRRLASLGRVAAGLAHEVRNPLAAIKIRVDLLREREPGGQTAVLLGAVSEEVTRLDALVDDLLTFARHGEGRDPLDLGALVCRRAEVLQPWAEREGARVDCRGEDSGVIVLGDARGLERVIDNLLRNAVEAARRGGAVDVFTRVAQDRVVVDIIDDGPGVPEDIADELFEPFVTTKDAGTGLGLALSRTIAEAHGGTLTYRREGDRSTFTLDLPTAPGRERTAA